MQTSKINLEHLKSREPVTKVITRPNFRRILMGFRTRESIWTATRHISMLLLNQFRCSSKTSTCRWSQRTLISSTGSLWPSMVLNRAKLVLSIWTPNWIAKSEAELSCLAAPLFKTWTRRNTARQWSMLQLSLEKLLGLSNLRKARETYSQRCPNLLRKPWSQERLRQRVLVG